MLIAVLILVMAAILFTTPGLYATLIGWRRKRRQKK